MNALNAEELYQEIILDHFRSPQGKGACADCPLHLRQHNPVCGDEIDLRLRLEDGHIAEIGFTGQGCAISQASASMLVAGVRGQTIESALDLAEKMRLLMRGAPVSDDIGDLEALGGVAKFPARVKCALLAWMALSDLLIKGASRSSPG